MTWSTLLADILLNLSGAVPTDDDGTGPVPMAITDHVMGLVLHARDTVDVEHLDERFEQYLRTLLPTRHEATREFYTLCKETLLP